MLFLFVISLIIAVSLPLQTAHSLNLKHRFVTVDEFQAGRVFVSDLDLDGDGEIITSEHAGEVSYVIFRDYLTSERGWRDVAQVNFEHRGLLHGNFLVDVTNDNFPDVLVVWQSGDGTVWIDGYASPLGTTPEGLAVRMGPFLQERAVGPGIDVGVVSVLGCGDFDRNGTSEIIVSSLPFRPGRQPRRVIAFESSTGRELWRHDTASAVNQIVVVERQDGGPLLVFAGYATDNGFDVDGTNDASSYVFCLSPLGELMWRLDFAGAHSRAYLAQADLNGDGKKELVVSRSRGNDPSDKNSPSLLLLEAATGECLREQTVPPSLLRCYAGKLTGARKEAILCPDILGALYCFDGSLEISWIRRPIPDVGHVVGVKNLDGKGKSEIFTRGSTRVYVLDERGKLISEAAMHAMITGTALANVGGRSLAVVVSGGVVRVLEFSRPDVSPMVLAVVLGLAATLLIAVILWLRVRATRSYRETDRDAGTRRG